MSEYESDFEEGEYRHPRQLNVPKKERVVKDDAGNPVKEGYERCESTFNWEDYRRGTGRGGGRSF